MLNNRLIVKIIGYISLIIWVSILLRVGPKFVMNTEQFNKQDISEHINVIRLAQVLRLVTVVLNIVSMISYRRPSFLGYAKTILKLILVFVFLESSTDHYWFALLAITWAMWECIIKANALVRMQIFNTFYYNSFIVICPAEVVLSVIVVNDYYNRHNEHIPTVAAILIRLFQVCLVADFINAYANIWKSRTKHYEEQDRKLRERATIDNARAAGAPRNQ